ncbi:DUF2752 domain-containing protein [Prescottella equi]|uniref:DUF2752 domain-containing protein n=1 Tax=Rhodococcus hoagii TaxID=43767 RepID=UPI000D0EB3D3|nr:DUF2752 domain-containing protein [Prescottella equi]AVP70702.1 hypothetical protein C7H75_23860 [Prescottella equi]MBM4733412.1 DUF2752 domain-containing protein [Prescottella equi]NKZ76728.1 DUF2752 domain-containing protein [Prescottella equi]
MTVPPAHQGLRRLAAPAAVAAAAFAVCGFVVRANPTVPGGPIPTCPTQALLGLDCPLCGSSRMLYALLHFDVPGALRYNAVGVAAAVVLVAAYVVWVFRSLRGRRRESTRRPGWVPVAVGSTLAVWFVVRNLPFEPFTGLRV